MREKTIILLGHSLIEYGDWQEWLPEFNVINLGVAGETTQGLASRLKYILENYPEADYYLIMSGINNIAMDDYDFLDSYRWIIRTLKESFPDSQILVHSILPCKIEFIDNNEIKKMNEKLKTIAESEGTHFLNLYDRFVDNTGEVVSEYLLDDGVHLSNAGYRIWCEVLKSFITT